MSVKLFTLNGWPASPTVSTVVRSYDIDAGIWSTSLAPTPFQGTTATSSNNVQFGGWDGNRWYVVSPTGGLYAYTPADDTWSGLLGGSGAIMNGTAEDVNWVMASDGAYIYILSSSNDFRRYDPSSNTLSSLSTPPGSAYARTLFLCSDGSGSIYGSKGGGSPAAIARYSISTNVWTAVSASGDWVTDMGGGQATWAFFLQGRLWMIQVGTANNILRAYKYTPASDLWENKATFTNGNRFAPPAPGHEESDSSIRIWTNNAGDPSEVYDINANTWSAGAAPPVTFLQGVNWAVSRVYSAAFVWYESDGTTLLATTVDLGTAVLGQELTYHAKVTTPVGRAGGVTVSVPNNTSTDAEDPVRICATVGGTYATSFATGALAAGDQFDVFVKFSPTASQTLGLLKRFSLQIS